MSRTGKIKVLIDTAEHPKMVELFEAANRFLGGLLEIERTTLTVGDYILKVEGQEPLVVSFKETNDFRQSFFSGHLFEEILAMNLQYPAAPKALIIAKDEDSRHQKDILIWVDTHWQKRNFLVPTFKFGSREKAVTFMVDCAMKIETLQVLPRSVKHAEDYNQTVGLYSFYGVGVEKAKKLAERFPTPMKLFENMKQFADYDMCQVRWDLDGRKMYADHPKTWEQAVGKKLTKKIWRTGLWWYGILGEETASRIEKFILEGTEIPKRNRGEVG